jgi:hypothetical protein
MTKPIVATNHCRHYKYNNGPKCAQGLDLSAPRAALACMPEIKDAPACELRAEYTDVERAAWAAWRDERAARMIVILAEIPGSSRDRKKRDFWGQSGAFPCPACDWGVVRWVRAASNGHVNAACTTPDCFWIIE